MSWYLKHKNQTKIKKLSLNLRGCFSCPFFSIFENFKKVVESVNLKSNKLNTKKQEMVFEWDRFGFSGVDNRHSH